MIISSSSVRNIYTQYFNIIDSFFGAIKHYLGKEVDSHIDLGRYIASYPLISDLILDAIQGLDFEIEMFWKENAQNVITFTKTQDSLKCLYSGKITPSILENFVKRSALYVDSIIIPDPLYKLSVFQKEANFERKYYLNMLIRNVFNVWKIKDLVLANSQENILLILPINLNFISSGERNKIILQADENFLEYTKNLTNRPLKSDEEIISFLDQAQSDEKFFEKFSNKNLLPREFQNFISFNKFLNNFGTLRKNLKLDQGSRGLDFVNYARGQFRKSKEHELFCDKLAATPIYDYDLPWFFFNYQIGGTGMDYAISNSLQKEKFEWITNLPISLVKTLREEGRLDYMRSCLRTGMTDLKSKDLLKTCEQIEKNFQEAFERQAKEIEFLKKEAEKMVIDNTINVGITTFSKLMMWLPKIGAAVSLVKAGRDIKKFFDQGEKIKKTKQKISEKESNYISILMEAHAKK